MYDVHVGTSGIAKHDAKSHQNVKGEHKKHFGKLIVFQDKGKKNCQMQEWQQISSTQEIGPLFNTFKSCIKRSVWWKFIELTHRIAKISIFRGFSLLWLTQVLKGNLFSSFGGCFYYLSATLFGTLTQEENRERMANMNLQKSGWLGLLRNLSARRLTVSPGKASPTLTSRIE